MKSLLLALSLLLAPTLAIAQPAPSVVDAQPLGETPGRADARLVCDLGGGRSQCGSGTLIGHSSRGTVAITNHHVIEGASAVFVINRGHKYRGKVLTANKQHDVALVEIPGRLAHVEIGGDVPEGEMLHFRAFDCGVHFRTWWAHPSQTYSVGGNSGGGVYHRGKLVGVIWGNRQDRIAFTPISRVRRMINDHVVTK